MARRGKLQRWIMAAVALSALVAGVCTYLVYRRQADRRIYHRAPALTVVPAREAVQSVVTEGLEGRPVPPTAAATLAQPGTALILAFEKGQQLSRVWTYDQTWAAALQRAAASVGREVRRARATPDAFYISLGYNYRPCNPKTLRVRSRGLVGLEATSTWETRALFPIEALTSGWRFRDWLRGRGRLQGRHLYQFDSLQYLLRPQEGGGFRIVPLVRGRIPGEPTMSRELALQMRDQMAGYLVREAQRNDGKLDYRYDPLRDKPSEHGIVLTRPILATWALAELASQGSLGDSAKAFLSNLKATMKAYYRPAEAKLPARLVLDQEADLGPVALGCLALQSSASKEVEWTQILDQLGKTLDGQWQPNGQFKTALDGSFSKQDELYAPGEALLVWARRYHASPSAELRRRFQASFCYYRDFYQERRTPASIPWHTMALAEMARLTEDREMEDFVFEMNDEVIQFLQPPAETPDLEGAFFTLTPTAPYYRRQAPNAADTAMYLHGLAEAYALARDRGQPERAEAYRQAIVKGLSFLRNLQYWREDDVAYLTPAARQRVAGGLRSTPWSPNLRVDNEARALLALNKILGELKREEDYRLPAQEAQPASPPATPYLPNPKATGDWGEPGDEE